MALQLPDSSRRGKNREVKTGRLISQSRSPRLHSSWGASIFWLGPFAIALFGSAAHANGAFPDEFSVHFPVSSVHRILLGSNFGLLVSEDDGANWRYACEPYVTSGSTSSLSAANVSFYQLTVDGAILEDSVDLRRSADVGCTWPASGGSVTGSVISDIFADPTDPGFVLAILATINGSSIVASHDGGMTFGTPLYTSSDLLTSVESARSARGVVYATKVGVRGGATLIRSGDSGSTWNTMAMLGGVGTQPSILAIDPADANTVYLRLLAGGTDSIAITTDGGQTVQVALMVPGAFTSFLRATDGALYAGQLEGNLYVRPVGATNFSRRLGPRLRCLGQRLGTSRIFGCGDMFVDGFNLGYSDDGGQTFLPMMRFTQILGPLTCAPVQSACAAHWERIQGVLGIAPDAGQPHPVPAGSHCAIVAGEPSVLLVLVALCQYLGRKSSRT